MVEIIRGWFVKKILLKGGDSALVDDEDYPLLSRFKWQRAGKPGYAVTTIEFTDGSNRTVYLHRLVVGGFCRIDHINLNVLDCRQKNLRRATMQQNGWNKGKNKSVRGKPASSQYKGVVRCIGARGNVYWRVIFKLSKKGEKPEKIVRLGPFSTEIKAAKAYNIEVAKHRGEWAWLNPIPNNKKPYKSIG
jgi:hypothetical protein